MKIWENLEIFTKTKTFCCEGQSQAESELYHAFQNIEEILGHWRIGFLKGSFQSPWRNMELKAKRCWKMVKFWHIWVPLARTTKEKKLVVMSQIGPPPISKFGEGKIQLGLHMTVSAKLSPEHFFAQTRGHLTAHSYRTRPRTDKILLFFVT